jgi:hypothetical protein
MARLENLPTGRGRRGRRPATRAPRRSFLIVCEGAVTEVRYFEAFPVRKDVHVAVRGEGKNTLSLIEAAVVHATRAVLDEAPYDEVWVVYDHDDFGADRFNRAADEIRAIDDSRPEHWQAAWSHQAFEVWYLLHFQFFDGQLHRHLVNKKLGELLQQHCGRTGYRKNDPQLYNLLLPHQPRALKHAEQLARKHRVDPFGDTPPAQANPCTQVYRLVEALNAEIH